MVGRFGTVVIAFLATGLLLTGVAFAEQALRQDDVVRALLDRSSLLGDAEFQIPAGLYRQYLRALKAPREDLRLAPIPYVAESGTYHLTISAAHDVSLRAELRLRVFDPNRCRNLPILNAKVDWKDIAVNGKAVKLATVDDWLRFTPPESGVYAITAKASLGKSGGGWTALTVARTVRTFVLFDSPGAWEVEADKGVAGRLIGTAEKGTHGRLAFSPRDKIRVDYCPPRRRRERPPRYILSGDVAWNLGAGAQQVTASLKAVIAGGSSDRIVLLLPDGAERVGITGPEVRRVQVTAGRAVVHLRGKVLGQTVLRVRYELPLGRGHERRLGRLGVADGHWAGGTLVVTNSAGGSEVMPTEMTGLRRTALAEIPHSARAILPAPAVLAYQITSRRFSAAVEVLRLGAFALRQSIADLAHYEVFLDRDGSVICRARYEIRNRSRQFLRIDLPAGSRVLLARVNEKSRPISARGTGVPTGQVSPVKEENMAGTAMPRSRWLLPLERSSASVMGLVSFPVEIVFVCRTARLDGKGVAEIPLPAIDLPVAYGWCETYVPDGLAVKEWSGAMRSVPRFSSETAKASLDYGWGELAAGYTEKDRPTVPPAPRPAPPVVLNLEGPIIAARPAPPTTRPAASQPSGRAEREMGVPVISRIPVLKRPFTSRAKVRDESGWSEYGFIQKPGIITTRTATPILAKNYYRAGKDFYDKGDYANAAKYLDQVVELAPGSTEARNAERLLANPQMPKARVLRTKAEKAAARVVEQELAELRRPLEQQQEKLLEEALAASRAGKTGKARSKLAAVEAMRRELLAQHADVREQAALMKKAQPMLKGLQERRAAEVGKLRRKLGELKKAEKYDEALEAAKKLSKHASDVEMVYGYTIGATVPTTRPQEKPEDLRKEIEFLAASASRRRQEQTKAQTERLRKERERKLKILIDRSGAFINARRYAESLELLRQIQDIDPDNRWASEQAQVVTKSLLAMRQSGRRREPLTRLAETVTAPHGSPGWVASLEPILAARKQEADAHYTQGLQRSRAAMQSPRGPEEFAKAAEEVRYARTLLETNKSLLADSEYRAKKIETEKLLEYIDLAKAKWQKEQVARQRIETRDRSVAGMQEMEAAEVLRLRLTAMEQLRRRREKEMARRRGEKIAMLKERARTLRDDQKYRQAIEICDQIRKLDPNDAWAAEWYSQLSRFVLLLEDKKADRARIQEEEVLRLRDIRQSRVPWYKLIRYPDDWPDKTVRRGEITAGKAVEWDAGVVVRRRLRQRLPVLKFSGIAFKDVVQFLRDVSGSNIHVKWGHLEMVGVVKTAPVNVSLTDVSLEKALRTILADVGGASPLGFVVDEGVITISNMDDLSRRTVTRVYDVRDLVVKPPKFGGRGAGGGGASNNYGNMAWDDADDDNMPSRRDSVDNVAELIRSRVARDTWGRTGGATGSIHRLGGKIVVTQTPEGQKEISDIIRGLRQPAPSAGVGRLVAPEGRAGDEAESAADRAAHGRLRRTLPRLAFDGIAFGDVVQFLRDVTGSDIRVRWLELEKVGIDKTSPVSINLTGVTLQKALRVILGDVGGVTPLGFVVDEGVVTISTKDDLSRKTVTRVYDIRDLVIGVPNFVGPTINIRPGGAGNNNNDNGSWGDDDDDDDDDDDETDSRRELLEDILDLLRSTIAPDTWRESAGGAGSIRELGGQIIVKQTPENQRALMDLLAQLRQARGPQVEEGEKIARQKAAETFLDDIQVDFLARATQAHAATRTQPAPRITYYNGHAVTVVDQDGGLRTVRQARVRITDRQLDEFIRRNYGWALDRPKEELKTTVTVPDGGTLLLGGQAVNVSGLVDKLRRNLGQKVTVNSVNVSADAAAAAVMGVRFRRGANNVNWGVINEAQFRSLMELDVVSASAGRSVAANGRMQETIVGTEAFLANGMVANVTFAGDKGNTLDVNGNNINLSHEGYVLIDNGAYLTVVQAGPMQHWREKPAVVQFVEVPQNIEVPRVGRIVRFERTLLEPSDRMVLRAKYEWKGE